jgi:hypothetical protein
VTWAQVEPNNASTIVVEEIPEAWRGAGIGDDKLSLIQATIMIEDMPPQ